MILRTSSFKKMAVLLWILGKSSILCFVARYPRGTLHHDHVWTGRKQAAGRIYDHRMCHIHPYRPRRGADGEADGICRCGQSHWPPQYPDYRQACAAQRNDHRHRSFHDEGGRPYSGGSHAELSGRRCSGHGTLSGHAGQERLRRAVQRILVDRGDAGSLHHADRVRNQPSGRFPAR